MRGMRYQPQGGASLNRGSPLVRGMQGLIAPGYSRNPVTGVPLVSVGGILPRSSPVGLLLPFFKNGYIETEVLPAIGTENFVEFWYGYPSAEKSAKGGSAEPGFLTGSSQNQAGICAAIGSNRSGGLPSKADSWGFVYNWSQNYLIDAGETLTPGVLTLLVVVRRQSGVEFWRNGRLIRYTQIMPASYPAQSLICGSFIEDTGYWSSANDTILAGRVMGDWSSADVQAFSANPWQIFAARDDDDDQLAAPKQYTLAAAGGSFSVAGAGAGLRAARRLPAASSTFALSGSAASLRAARILAAWSGALALAGAPARLLAARRAPATPGAFALGGAGAQIRAARKLQASAGAFALTGGSVSMTYVPAPGPGGPTYTLTAAPGAFGLAGALAALRVQRRLLAAPGGLLLNGTTARLRVARRIPAQPGAFVLVGAGVTLAYRSTGSSFDISKIPPARIVVFEGSGSRVVLFESSGSRMVPFEGSGSRVTLFEGSGSRVTRFE